MVVAWQPLWTRHKIAAASGQVCRNKEQLQCHQEPANHIQRPVSIKRYRLTGIGFRVLKIRRSSDRLIFNMGIPYLERLPLYWNGVQISLQRDLLKRVCSQWRQSQQGQGLWGVTHFDSPSVPGGTSFVSCAYRDLNVLPNNDEITPLIVLIIIETTVLKFRSIVCVDHFGVFSFFALFKCISKYGL